jgi:23S rRNA (cytidine2498-2'-O)-methyltransferase
MDEAPFLFTCCQAGAEAALKSELAVAHPGWRFAYSRPGFVTFKWAGSSAPKARLQLKSVFARCYGWSLGGLSGAGDDERVESLISRLSGKAINQLHVWQRAARGAAGGLPQIVSAATQEFGELVLQRLIDEGNLPAGSQYNQPARRGQTVCDCIFIDRDRWWLGWHQATSFCQHWPGGVPRIEEPSGMVSRAYLKMREAIMWSGLPLKAGQRCIDIGSAPGGASQALLEAGLTVLGVDPAEMDPQILAHPHFIHLRKRGADVKRRDYRGYQWLVVDSNVAPGHTLDTVEAIVTHQATSVQGMLLTLKLLDWRLAGEIAEYVGRVRSWGYEDVRCRQLACNHQEVCLAALRSRAMRRRQRGQRHDQAARR